MSKREGSPAAGGERTWSSETSNGSDVKTPQPLNAFCVNPAAPASKVASALGPATAYETFSSGASAMYSAIWGRGAKVSASRRERSVGGVFAPGAG